MRNPPCLLEGELLRTTFLLLLLLPRSRCRHSIPTSKALIYNTYNYAQLSQMPPKRSRSGPPSLFAPSCALEHALELRGQGKLSCNYNHPAAADDLSITTPHFLFSPCASSPK